MIVTTAKKCTSTLRFFKLRMFDRQDTNGFNSHSSMGCDNAAASESTATDVSIHTPTWGVTASHNPFWKSNVYREDYANQRKQMNDWIRERRGIVVTI